MMKKEKNGVKATLLSLLMAVCLMLPMSLMAQKSDGFFRSNNNDVYNDRDSEIGFNITNDEFDAPLGSGLLIMMAAGVGYAAARRKKAVRKSTTLLLACVLMLGMTQCKKKQTIAPNTVETVTITLNVNNGNNGSRADVNTETGAVVFKKNDKIHVYSNGVSVGTLTHNGTNFSGSISGATDSQPLYFYFLGNKTLQNESGNYYVDIDDQSKELPVISMAPSNEDYSSSRTSYSASLHNKCSLIKFTVTTPSSSPICITGMNNRVYINFSQYDNDESNNGFTYGMNGDGVIKMAGGSGTNVEKLAIVLPQGALATTGEAYSADNSYTGTRPTMPVIRMGKYINSGIAIEVSDLNPDGPMATPLTFEAKISNSSVTFTQRHGSINLKYKKNNDDWTNYTMGSAITLENEGDKVSFKGTNSRINTQSYSFNYFSCSGQCYIYGNVMSLINETDYSTTFGFDTNSQYALLCLFNNNGSNNTTIYSHNSVKLILPATILSKNCYERMFYGCKNLTDTPDLPATTLTNDCYKQMFNGCTSIISAPELPATTLANNCYQQMFYNCTGLINAPELPATTLAPSCYNSMFYGCNNTSFTAPELPATELASSCYQQMFSGCNRMTSAPELNALTLATSCYENMFYGCSYLTSAPALDATTLAQSCYKAMFQGCSSLTSAPELKATTLATSCYENMFYGCSNLTSAPALDATTLAQSCYKAMFQGCTKLTSAPTLSAMNLANSCYYYMFRGCNKLTSAPELPATTLVENCYYGMFYGCSLISTSPSLSATDLASYCYREMFYGCTSLENAPNLPATILKDYCYYQMFMGCTKLETAPDLEASTLAKYSYYEMFKNCSKLNSVKCLATDISASNCTSNWLSGTASTGTRTFTKASSMTSWTTGASGIPSGWTIVDE